MIQSDLHDGVARESHSRHAMLTRIAFRQLMPRSQLPSGAATKKTKRHRDAGVWDAATKGRNESVTTFGTKQAGVAPTELRHRAVEETGTIRSLAFAGPVSRDRPSETTAAPTAGSWCSMAGDDERVRHRHNTGVAVRDRLVGERRVQVPSRRSTEKAQHRNAFA